MGVGAILGTITEQRTHNPLIWGTAFWGDYPLINQDLILDIQAEAQLLY